MHAKNHRLEKTHIESYKTTDTVGLSSRGGTGTDFCKTCGRLLPEAEQVNAKLLEEQEKLLSEINAAKAEVLTKLAELKKSKEENEGGAGMLFNVKNLGSLQELLDQAEETDDMLLFTDKKQNVWQIVKRNDIDIANNNPNDDAESGGAEPAAVDEGEPGAKNQEAGAATDEEKKDESQQPPQSEDEAGATEEKKEGEHE